MLNEKRSVNLFQAGGYWCLPTFSQNLSGFLFGDALDLLENSPRSVSNSFDGL